MAATKKTRVVKTDVVLDTNVIMADPYCLSTFHNANVVIPLTVVEEADKHKNGNGSIAASCRIFLRKLDELANENLPKKTLGDGVVLSKENNTTLMVYWVDPLVGSASGLDLSVNDNLIIECAARLGKNTKLITNYAAMRVKANLLKISAEGFKDEGIEERNLFSDAVNICVSDLDHTDISMCLFEDKEYKFDTDIHKDILKPNKPVIISNSANDTITQCISVGDGVTVRAIPLLPKNKGIYGLTPKNKDQRFALDFLMDDKISVVSLIGKAGSGKTICAMAAGLHKVIEEQM
jgi:PhoH-like ATPase